MENILLPKIIQNGILNALDSFFDSQKYPRFSKMDKKNVQFSLFKIFHEKKK